MKTIVRLETDLTDKALAKAQEFEVRVMVDSVEHLAGFAVTINYDPKKLQPVLTAGASASQGGTPLESTPSGSASFKTRAPGEFLASSGRQNDLVCTTEAPSSNSVTLLCNLRGSPVCLGGAPGASGSGLLGAVFFQARGEGTTKLTLDNAGTQLALDDYAPPCGDTSDVPKIEHRLGPDATVKLESGGSSTLLIIVVVVVVVVVAAGGAGAYVWYRRREPGAPPPSAPAAPRP